MQNIHKTRRHTQNIQTIYQNTAKQKHGNTLESVQHITKHLKKTQNLLKQNMKKHTKQKRIYKNKQKRVNHIHKTYTNVHNHMQKYTNKHKRYEHIRKHTKTF